MLFGGIGSQGGGWVSKTEKSADIIYGWYLNLHIIMVMATANPTIAKTIARLIRFLYFSSSKILSIFSLRKRSSSRVRSWPLKSEKMVVGPVSFLATFWNSSELRATFEGFFFQLCEGKKIQHFF